MRGRLGCVGVLVLFALLTGRAFLILAAAGELRVLVNSPIAFT